MMKPNYDGEEPHEPSIISGLKGSQRSSAPHQSMDSAIKGMQAMQLDSDEPHPDAEQSLPQAPFAISATAEEALLSPRSQQAGDLSDP